GGCTGEGGVVVFHLRGGCVGGFSKGGGGAGPGGLCRTAKPPADPGCPAPVAPDMPPARDSTPHQSKRSLDNRPGNSGPARHEWSWARCRSDESCRSLSLVRNGKTQTQRREWPGVLALSRPSCAAVLLGMPHRSRYRRSWRGSVIGGDLPREHRLLSGRVWPFLQVEPTAAVHLPGCDGGRTPPRGADTLNTARH